jgi:hypothetical protein
VKILNIEREYTHGNGNSWSIPLSSIILPNRLLGTFSSHASNVHFRIQTYTVYTVRMVIVLPTEAEGRRELTRLGVLPRQA